ncbi:MAG TPA: polymer-forming cytoskeletal protein [Bacteroidales bacterium]|nr:polymer-forming cytoskeletal protein [Bacteroidales bacterium]HNZ42108.1 polymer-forming cytoskeletal protein [Bacteroidales bacterium]HOH83089.1 polymer-forming cytoskeletal protein [Bacteroidales bacterium]HPB24351.1 polymer-forming cytoskeletal protein [Bacteroidales bacterium]HPI29018.1 polymer-forming cytoskeletal protein [Bacteroidales bacterium]
MAKNTEVEAPVINILGNGTSIKGDIKASGDMRIDGTLIGTINARGKVVIGPTGRVDGEIICQSADFSGNLNGKITVTELLAMKASSQILGDIVTGKLSVEPGAKFTGNCKMSETPNNHIPASQEMDEKFKKTAQ